MDSPRLQPRPPRRDLGVFLDAMFRAQWRGENRTCSRCGLHERGTAHCRCDEAQFELRPGDEAHAIGPYGEVYAERKEWNLARGWNGLHAERDARRIMSKRVIRDLWRAWRRSLAEAP